MTRFLGTPSKIDSDPPYCPPAKLYALCRSVTFWPQNGARQPHYCPKWLGQETPNTYACIFYFLAAFSTLQRASPGLVKDSPTFKNFSTTGISSMIECSKMREIASIDFNGGCKGTPKVLKPPFCILLVYITSQLWPPVWDDPTPQAIAVR